MNQFSENDLITMIINSSNFLEIFSIYYSNVEQLKDYTILIFDDQITKSINKKPPLELTKKLKKAKIVSIFKSSFCILNEIMCHKMLQSRDATFEYKNCFDLDINMMNILTDFHNGSKDVEVNSIMTDLNLFSNDITCYPYLMENAGKIDDSYVEECVIKTLLIFNKFKHSTLQTFSADYLNTEQDYQDTKKSIEMMRVFSNSTTNLHAFLALQKFIYALLLKTAILSFSSNNGIRKRMIELMEFVNNDIAIFLEREMVYCYWFLKNRNDERIKKFFRGIQSNSKNIIKTIQGMSWDLFHLRFCTEVGMATDIGNGTICIHYLITQDNGLADLANAHPIKFLIYKKGDIAPKVIFAEPIYDLVSEIDIFKNLLDNRRVRNSNYRNVNIESLIKKLEDELYLICCS